MPIFSTSLQNLLQYVKQLGLSFSLTSIQVYDPQFRLQLELTYEAFENGSAFRVLAIDLAR